MIRPGRRTLARALALPAWLATACSAPAQAPPTAPVEPAGSAAVAPTASGAADDHEDDERAKAAATSAPQPPTAGGGDGATIALENLLGKPAPGAAKDFPKPTATDKDCTRDVGLTGKADKDYEALLAKCGAPTGLKEYARRVGAKLDGGHKRQRYSFKMLGGYCYRFFAVGDESLNDLDIRVERPNGDIVSAVQSKGQPLSIMDPDRPWCKTHDRDFVLVIETRGGGHGQFQFGVWARPK